MLFYKCLKDKAMNIEINQYSYLSPKNNKQKGTILDTNTRMVSFSIRTVQSSIFSTLFIFLYDKIKI